MVAFIVGHKDGLIGLSDRPAKFEILNVTKAALLDLMRVQHANGVVPNGHERSDTLEYILMPSVWLRL